MWSISPSSSKYGQEVPRLLPTIRLLLLFLLLVPITDALNNHVTPPVLSFNNEFYLHPNVQIVDLSDTERGIQVGEIANANNGESIQDIIRPNEVILSIPIDHIITTSRAKKDLESRMMTLNDEGVVIDDQTILALWLCHHQHQSRQQQEQLDKINNNTANDDFINTYLDMLPTNLQHIPTFWSDTELAELEGSVLYDDTLLKRQRWTELYHNIIPEKIDPNFSKRTSLEAFFWAKALVESRAFRLRQDYVENDQDLQQRDIGFVPYADMLNHCSRSNPYTCDWKVERQQSDEDGSDHNPSSAFVIRAGPLGLQSGTEVYHSYGLHTNRHYLSCYGFAIENNLRHDGLCPNEAHIGIPFNKYDTGQVPSKKKKIIYNQSNQRRVSIRIGDTENAINLLAELRESVSCEDRRDSRGDPVVNEGFRVPLSIDNERETMIKLQQYVDKALSRYKTTVQEDLKLLQYDLASSNQRSSILLRFGEKNVLCHWQAVCKASLFCLEDVENDTMSWSDYCKLLQTTLDRTNSIVSLSETIR